MKPEKTTLKRVADLWVLVKKENHMEPVYLGSAGYPEEQLICFVRHGKDVHIHDFDLLHGKNIDTVRHTITADAVVKGSGNPALEDKPLSEILNDGVFYDHRLELIPTSS